MTDPTVDLTLDTKAADEAFAKLSAAFQALRSDLINQSRVTTRVDITRTVTQRKGDTLTVKVHGVVKKMLGKAGEPLTMIEASRELRTVSYNFQGVSEPIAVSFACMVFEQAAGKVQR